MSETAEKILPPPQPEQSVSPSFIKRCFRVLVNTGKGFIEDDCYAKASALTFYSLLSIVPVLAVLFGIAKGFGFEKALESEINQQFSEQKELVAKLIEFAYSWLQTVQGGLIAGIGTLTLLWTVFGLLNNIETALNAIWKTRNARPYSRKISDYLATMLVSPLFLVTSSSINVFISTQITQTAQNNILVEAVSPVLIALLKLFPYFLSWVLFTFIYLFMPNTKVYLRSALIAGVIAGTAFQIWQWIYIKFQIGVASYGAIYGSFAALPLFLIWLQFSWNILLAGAEMAFEIENDLFIPARRLTPISNKAIALLITYRCVEAFVKGESPLTDRALSHELGMSLNHLQLVLEALQSDRILSAVSFHDKTIGYQPARAIDSITMKKVCDAVERSERLMASVRESPQMNKITTYLNEVDEMQKESKDNQPLYAFISTPIPSQKTRESE
ncbi:RNase BN, tRNA processing enzyme [Candidatus Protochlamydia naegleriophila]|uniref:RNase BN, tRNA processing enzyme n=1 Tax=Candidatus Protochlamydia naegleriophila TaxID=389348 RepID=A0A0U5JAJ4_9BACT|nr:YihY/virulence factor BrkB family protein [Candidatus Protochlamydia naegleriophila]CUI16824.1 RNase BN, tRNA processing enzyme [Candidatus Protochlamydia naegleriophila]